MVLCATEHVNGSHKLAAHRRASAISWAHLLLCAGEADRSPRIGLPSGGEGNPTGSSAASSHLTVGQIVR
jgi:hypothetical protein